MYLSVSADNWHSSTGVGALKRSQSIDKTPLADTFFYISPFYMILYVLITEAFCILIFWQRMGFFFKEPEQVVFTCDIHVFQCIFCIIIIIIIHINSL